MPQLKRVDDKWKHLRADLYGNTEPQITIDAVTMPVILEKVDYYCDALPELSDEIIWPSIEQLPALAASTSYGSKERIEGDMDKALSLNRKLIELGHETPLEAIQFNFHISGISKACGAQLSRHRVGQGHVSASRRFKKAEPQFVYPNLDYLEHESQVNVVYNKLAHHYEMAFIAYQNMLNGALCPSLKKEDARMVLPISYATERSWWINARALRALFKLRLAADAEWEIRRLSWMIYDLVTPLMPSLFDDINTNQITNPPK